MAKSLPAMARAWARLDEELKAVREREAEARAELVAAAFPGGLDFGVNIAEVVAGALKVKAFVRPNAKLDQARFKGGLELLSKVPGVGQLLAERLARAEFKLSLTEWKKLGDDHQALFEGAVAIEKSAPSVELVGA